MKTNYLSLSFITNFLLCFLPVSLILGNLIININLLLFIIFGTLLIKQKNLKINFNKANVTLLLFFCAIIFSTIVNINIITTENLIKSIIFLKFLFLFFLIEVLGSKDQLNFKRFFYIYLLCTFTISIDLLIQYFYKLNIVGIKPTITLHNASFFGQEAVAGGYLAQSLPFSVAALIILFKTNKSKLLIIPITTLFLVAVLITFNRMPFILSLIFIFLLIILCKNYRIIFLTALIIFSLLFTSIYKNDNFLKYKYENFVKKIFNYEDFSQRDLKSKKTIKLKSKNIDDKFDLSKLNFFSNRNSSNHGMIYLLAFNDAKENILFGNGFKSSRLRCSQKFNPIPCVNFTHPHNYHIEVLADTGLLGFFILSFFVLIIIIRTLRINNKSFGNHQTILIIIFSSFLIEVWPLKSTGSFFSTFSGTSTWLIISIVNLISQKKKLIK